MDKKPNQWGAAVIGHYVYEGLDDDIWKESVHFIAKQLGLTNRTNVVFQTKAGHKRVHLPLTNGLQAKKRYLMTGRMMTLAHVVHTLP